MAASSTLPPLLRIGARPSRLALVQAQACATPLAALLAKLPHAPQLAIRAIASRGDVITDRPLSELGGREAFVGALQAALQGGAIDVAVHSLKDMPHQQPDGLVIAAILPRAAAGEMLVAREKSVVRLDDLPLGARIGTASPRRQAQLRAFWPHLAPVLLRGNVETRIKKIAAGEAEGAILAHAGLQRLGLAEKGRAIPIEAMLPAAGQGALAVEARKRDKALCNLLAKLNHQPSAVCVAAERAFTGAFGASCHTALAALAQVRDEQIFLRAQYFPPDAPPITHESTGALEEAQALGCEAAAVIRKKYGRPLDA